MKHVNAAGTDDLATALNSTSGPGTGAESNYIVSFGGYASINSDFDMEA